MTPDQEAKMRAALERKMGKALGDGSDPLLVSVRSGAPFSMPGMMDTVLNLGLNDESVEGLAAQTGNDQTPGRARTSFCHLMVTQSSYLNPQSKIYDLQSSMSFPSIP